MKLKEIYKENLGRKYRNVIDIKGDNVQLNSSPVKKIKELEGSAHFWCRAFLLFI